MSMYSSLIEQMQRPGFYPHKTEGEIRHIQTHISHVFLTGEYAYKVKKPFDLGFLDFSSLAKRKHFCREELRLNKIFAPEIYLSVVPIYNIDGKYGLEPSGDPFEYAVKMRQFRQEDIFSNIVSKQPDKRLFEDLARRIAGLHDKAATNEKISAHGAPSSVKKTALDNFSQTKQFIGRSLPEESYTRIKKYTLGFLDEKEELFYQRQSGGHIKECHGDLHLRNICLYNDEIQLFDRIEFNEAFKNIDTVYDFAFLVMDLQYRGYDKYASVLSNQYFEITGDYEGAGLLNFYCSLRAYIRGKVISLELNDEDIGKKEKEAAKDKANKYFHLAEDYCGKGQGKLLLMSGASGSGKSTVAGLISENHAYLMIRSDALRKHLAAVPLHEKAPQSAYSSEMSEKTYNQLIDLGIHLASLGVSVILDAKFDKQRFRQIALDKALEKEINAGIIHCKAGEKTLKTRLRQRENDVSDATAEIIDKQLQSFEPFSAEEKGFVYSIDTESLSQHELVEKIKSDL